MNTHVENALVAIARKVPAVRPRDESAIREILADLVKNASPVTITPTLTADEVSLIRDSFKARIG